MTWATSSRLAGLARILRPGASDEIGRNPDLVREKHPTFREDDPKSREVAAEWSAGWSAAWPAGFGHVVGRADKDR